MQKEFNKLNRDKQRKFIIKNLIKDEYFDIFHKKIKILYVEEIYKKNEHELNISLRNEYLLNKITKILTRYRDDIIDYHNNPTSHYFHERILNNKNKLKKILSKNINYNFTDENNFTIKDLILDTWNSIKNIVTVQEFSLENLI